MNTFEAVYKAVAKIPKGKVSTYGNVAKYIGITNPKVVGYALHSNKTPDTIPCHRVVNIKGELAPGYAFGGPTIQKQLLEQEGITFDTFDDKPQCLALGNQSRKPEGLVAQCRAQNINSQAPMLGIGVTLALDNDIIYDIIGV